GDNTVEPTETFTVDLTSTSASLGYRNITFADAQGVGTVTDNDAATLSINDVSVAEDVSGGTATFAVTLSGVVQNNFTVQYQTADQTAVSTSSSDYTAKVLTTLTFGGAYSNTQNIVVTITNDAVSEATENYYVNLLNLTPNSQNVTIADNQGLGTITDNDATTVSINSPAAVTEGTNITFTVTSTNAVQGGFTIAYSTQDVSAMAGSDYTSNTGTLAFAGTANETKTIVVTTINDIYREPQETFSAILGAITLTSANVSIASGTGTGTINDNDAASIAIGDRSVNEDAGTATFTVTLTGNVQDVFTVNYASSNNTPIASALAGSDYTTASGTLTFPAGSLTTATQ
ncbi:hypothetical protein JZU61_05765, partial [bacterium]|nr:hypothetical protein [bacterium]